MTLLDDPTPTEGLTRQTLDGCPHEWTVESRHATSEGVVRYLRCPACGVRCVDLLPRRQADSAVGISRTVRPVVDTVTASLPAG